MGSLTSCESSADDSADAGGLSGAGGAAGAGGAGETGGTGGASGTSGTGGGDACPTEGSDAASDPAAEVGQFSVQLVAPREATPLEGARAGSTAIIGTVGDRIAPERTIWEPSREEGGCRLNIPRSPLCDPGCGRDVCVEDDTCKPDRAQLDVGTVTIRGVMTNAGASEVELISIRNTYQSGTTTLPYPAFDEGDAITLSATGACSIPAFEIEASGIAALQVIDEGEYIVADDEELTMRWMPAEEAGASQVQIRLDISHHGGSKGKLECDVEDNGAFTLPAALVSELLALGVAGFPSIVLERRAIETAQLPHGRVALRVYEYAERFVTIPGLVSCTADEHCPSGQICGEGKACE